VPAPRRRARLWLRTAAAVGALLASGWLGCEGWAAWHERAARQALASEDFDAAHRHVDLALRVHPGRASTNFLAARVDRARAAYAEAERHLVRCKELGGMTDPLQTEWTLLRCERGDVDELAPGLLAAVGRDHPESAAILESLARVYMRQARYHEALAALNGWVERAPDSPRALDWRGWVNNQLDHRGQAIDDYTRALELQPGRSAARLRLAQLLVESSRAPDALPHLERLRSERPDDPDVTVGLAACYAVQLRTEDARRLLDGVLAAHPDHFGALRTRGNLERDDGRYAESERWLRRAVAIKPLDPQARYSLHLALLAQPGREAEAEAERLRWERDREVTARLTRLMRTELAGRPGDPDLAAEAGELLLRVGEDQRGLFWLNRALGLDPGHVASHRVLADYYTRTNNPTAAAAHQRYLPAAGSKN
jgi:tetratricopeptide (TPR) repeat protein